MGRKPDYVFSVREIATGDRCRIGAAWINDNGSIAITLNPSVVLDWRMGKGFNIMLFPNNGDKDAG